MCGIVGYLGPRTATDVLLGGLSRLEYRGYDSAGIAVLDSDSISVVRRVGKLVNLKNAVETTPVPGNVGIGHTRWATHGRPSEENAHPHADCKGRVAVVHNGIIENYAELREELAANGHILRSETDTETIAHLIESYYDGDLVSAVTKALKVLEGSYALAIVHADHPGTVVAARQDSPLIIGVGEGENIVASDIPAVLEYTREVLVLHDGDVAEVTAQSIVVRDAEGRVTEPEMMHVEWDLDAAEKSGYEDFMLKEIFEQPKAIRETLRGRLGEDGQVQLSELAMTPEQVAAIDRVYIIACGTSLHAGIVAKTLIEAWVRTPVEVQCSSEFRYCDPIVDDETLVVAITQSGETADTLAGVREARERGAKVIAITNVVGSRVTRESDGVLYTHAGPEIGVAATKTFTSQIAALTVLALKLAQVKGTLSDQIQMDRYDNYYGGSADLKPVGPAFLDRVTFKMMPEASSRVAALLAGEVQIIEAVPPQLIDRLKATPDILVQMTGGTRPKMMDMNTQKPPFNDLRVRQAFNYGADRKALLKAIAGDIGELLPGPLSPQACSPLAGPTKRTPRPMSRCTFS